MIRYTLADMSNSDVSQLIETMVAENPDINENQIAAKLKVNISRSPVDGEALDRALKKLKAVRISPILDDGEAVDFSEYEFWYDNWQESVHYVLTSPPKHAPEDKLVRWMIEFRATAAELVKTPSARSRSNQK